VLTEKGTKIAIGGEEGTNASQSKRGKKKGLPLPRRRARKKRNTRVLSQLNLTGKGAVELAVAGLKKREEVPPIKHSSQKKKTKKQRLSGTRKKAEPGKRKKSRVFCVERKEKNVLWSRQERNEIVAERKGGGGGGKKNFCASTEGKKRERQHHTPSRAFRKKNGERFTDEFQIS